MDADEPLLLDRLLPHFDARAAAIEIVDADPAATWTAVLTLDLLQIHTPLLDAAMWVRGLPEHLGRRVPAPPIERLTLTGDDPLPGWHKLGERPGAEIVVGAVGVFWTPRISWRDIDPVAFADFDDPGYGKVVAGWSVLPYGTARTLLTYECRTLVTDAESRHKFLRYWRLVRPFVGHIMRATVRTIRDDALALEASVPAA